jgi:hypothetical protein
VLVVRHKGDDSELLKGLCGFLNSPDAAAFILKRRPSVKHRMSYPKISAKDLNALLHPPHVDEDSVRRFASMVTEEPLSI